MRGLFFISWLVFSSCALSQGTVFFHNRVNEVVIAPVFGNEPGDPSIRKTGNTSTGFPAGNQVYNGNRLSGANWVAQLYGGPLGTPDESLVPLFPTVSFRSGVNAGFLNPSNFLMTIPGIPQGDRARFQLRVYDGTTGPNYDLAINRGVSTSFDSLPLGGGIYPPPNLVGLTSFNVALVPEPRVSILFMIGFFGLIAAFRRKKIQI